MFDVPDAKRVRRGDLNRSSTSPSPEQDAGLQFELQKRLDLIYDALAPAATPSSDAAQAVPARASLQGRSQNGNEDVDMEDGRVQAQETVREGGDEKDKGQVFEFRLFSTPSDPETSRAPAPAPAVQRIVLDDGDAEAGGGSFVVRARPQSYYIAQPAPPEQKAQFMAVAVTGADVLGRREGRAWGLEVPWRVQRLVVHVSKSRLGSLQAVPKKRFSVAETASVTEAARTQEVELISPSDIEAERQEVKKKKPGKKRRIILREREKKREEKRKALEIKEESEKEKRTRRNREKKVKKKAREKAAKLAGKSSGDGVVDDNSDSDGEFEKGVRRVL